MTHIQKVRHHFRTDNSEITIQDLAEKLGIKESSLRTAFSYHKNQFVFEKIGTQTFVRKKTNDDLPLRIRVRTFLRSTRR